MSDEQRVPVTLLSPEATGGDIATAGFGFQDAVLLAKLPRFLAEDGFTAVIREALCDFEASFFAFPSGLRREGFEAKDYPLAPTAFWAEIDTFDRMNETDLAAYGGFTLISTGLSDKVQPVTNGLRRVRDPYPFYDADSALLDASYAEYEQRVVGHGQSGRVARLLFDKVRVESNWSAAERDAYAAFLSTLHEHHPWSLNCPSGQLQRCYAQLKTLVGSRKNTPIMRHEIETAIASQLSPGTVPQEPLRFHTAATRSERAPSGAVIAQWEKFSGNDGRSYPSSDDWEREVLAPLMTFRKWSIDERRPRRVRLSGTRRLSTSLAIGAVLSAVNGFSIDMEYRDTVWATDAHPTGDTPGYAVDARLAPGADDRLVVTIGILRDIRPEVSTYADRVGLGQSPRLDLAGAAAVESDRHLNSLVRDIKNKVSEALGTTGAKSVHLFLAGPAPLALFLGHRLNAVASVQCYEWIANQHYIPTCVLFKVP